jgi:flagellar motor component MotA
MNRDEFTEQYAAFVGKALELAAKARRESLLGLSADPQKVIERDIFEYGLSFAIDGVAPEIIDEILGNIVAQEKDEYMRLYKTIQMRAVLGIQQGYNAKILYSILNSLTDMPLEK